MRSGSSTHHPLERRGTDIDDAVALYEQVYSSENIHIDRATAGFRYRYRSVGDENVSLATSAVDARRCGTIVPGRDYILAWAMGPGITLDTDSDSPIEMLPGTPVMYPVGRPFEFEALPTTQHLLRFNGAFLEGIEAAGTGDEHRALHFGGTPPAESLRTLRDVLGRTASTLLDVAAPAALRRRAGVVVAEAVIAAFRPVPAASPGRTGSRATRRAQEWIVEHAGEPISISDVAAATGTGARTLQAAFQRHVGMSPMEFLRSIRLHRVRSDLLQPDRSWSVSQRAAVWGFTHMGRFSAYYASQFGELPSAALARGKAIRSASRIGA